MNVTTIELRNVKLLFDSDNNMYNNITVSIIRKPELIPVINSECVFVGDVEYTDGTFLSVYDYAGAYVGLEYDSNCELILENEAA